MRGGFGAFSGRVGFFFFVLVACVQIALTAPASAQQPTASDFTVTAPYGSTAINYSFVGHATGGYFQVDVGGFSQLGAPSVVGSGSAGPGLYVSFYNPGFVRAGAVRYWTCTSDTQCTGADRADATITFVPTGVPTPVVTSVAVPADGSYQAGDQLQFTVNFDHDVTVTGTPRIEMNVGRHTRYADYVSGSGSRALVFTHTVQPLDMALRGIIVTALRANGGTIRSAAYADANLALNNMPSTAGVLVDTTPLFANDFTVTAPYGSIRVNYNFEAHAGGGFYQIRLDDFRQLGNFPGGSVGGWDPAFFVDFFPPGFVAAGTVPYEVCRTLDQCIGATITFVPTGAPTPAVSSVAVPADGTYRAGDPLQFTVNFDLDVTVTGTPQIALNVGGATRYATYVSGSGSSALVFTYAVQPGDMAPGGIAVTALSANGGMIRSVAHADANLALNIIGDASGVLIDATPPEVQAVSVVGSPPSNAGNITLEIVFSEPVTGFVVAGMTPLPPAGSSAALANLRTCDNITYQVDVDMTGPGTYGIQIAAGSVVDAAGNGNVAYTNNSVWVRLSDDASLSSIVSSAGALNPVFASGTLAYTLAVDHDTETLTLTPLVSNSDATVTVDGQGVTSGSASQPVALAVGANVITILVTAQDGTSTQSYTVTATRAPSGDARLTGLATSAGAVDPVFTPTVFAYALAVNHEVDSLSVTPTVAEATAMVTVDGQAVASGSASQPVALAVGANVITILVTAQDGTSTQSYTVTATRAPSGDARLTGLATSAGSIDPAFTPTVFGYGLTVGHEVDSLSVTPTVAEATATVTVDGQAVTSGSASQPVALAVGANVITILVTAQDGTSTQSYTVTATRAPSGDARLTGLATSVGSIDPAFTPTVLAYALAVGHEVDSLSVTPTVAEATATVTVDGQAVTSGSASQPVALAVGATPIRIDVTAADGTVLSYRLTVDRLAASNASLAALSIGIGALEPAFSPGTSNYTVNLDHDTENLTFTPAVADTNATVTVNGQAVASGTPSQALPLAVGPNAVSIVVTAQDRTSTQTYTVTIVRAGSADANLAGLLLSAGTLEPAFSPGTRAYSVAVDHGVEMMALTPTAAHANAAITIAGQSVASGAASQPVPLAIGSNTVSVTVTAQNGSTSLIYTVTATRAEATRPDPSQDAEVVGLLNAQLGAARRFAQTQTRNFGSRLEQLHNEGDRRASSMNVRFGLQQDSSVSPAQRELEQLTAARQDASGGQHAGQMPGMLAYGASDANLAPGTATANSELSSSSSLMAPDFGPFAFWSGGFVNFSERDSGGIDLDSTMVGVSGGVDYRFSQRFVGGFGVGYSRDQTDIGSNGTESRGAAFSGALYGSYKPVDNLFIDGLIGASRLDFDSRRFVTANGEFAEGSRSGAQLFGSLTASYEFRGEKWLISPYGRAELSRSWLDGFTETGGGSYGLTYGDQTIDTLSGVLGIRASYAFDMDWGVLTPGVRAEYTHDFDGSSRVSLGYTDIGGLPYAIDIDPTVRDYATLGLSLDMRFDNDWDLGFDYRTSFGGSGNHDHAFGAKLGVRF
ncbi:cadherin-like beta sandwich domain-containing protein [Mesorhizobium sp. CAU 1732]|uniref:cadherin-like beta sandwich domain-containing protein n=1 Tax=Mesorhizobium sp. CAU 1732 TaxID=3140358 RepID=UPI00325FF0DD